MVIDVWNFSVDCGIFDGGVEIICIKRGKLGVMLGSFTSWVISSSSLCSKHKKRSGRIKVGGVGGRTRFVSMAQNRLSLRRDCFEAAWEMTPIQWGCTVPQTEAAVFLVPYYSNVDTKNSDEK